MPERDRTRPAWFDEMLCRGQGELFFSDDPVDTDAAKAICRVCPVRFPCLSRGLDQVEGVWGGTDPEERAELRAARQRRGANGEHGTASSAQG